MGVGLVLDEGRAAGAGRVVAGAGRVAEAGGVVLGRPGPELPPGRLLLAGR